MELQGAGGGRVGFPGVRMWHWWGPWRWFRGWGREAGEVEQLPLLLRELEALWGKVGLWLWAAPRCLGLFGNEPLWRGKQSVS